MEQELTPWFNALKHNPVRDGWYDFGFNSTLNKSVWFHQRWQWENGWYNKYGSKTTLLRGDKWRGILKTKE